MESEWARVKRLERLKKWQAENVEKIRAWQKEWELYTLLPCEKISPFRSELGT